MGTFNSLASNPNNIIESSNSIGGITGDILNSLGGGNTSPAKAAKKALSSFNKSSDANKSASIQNPFMIGDFLLTGMEVPTQLDSIGGDQMLAVHNFPGGVRTVQSLGAFPPSKITWKGIFIGTNAWTRAYALDRLRIDGALIKLSYSKWQWMGKIETFHVLVKHEWFASYTIEFIPTKDISATPVKQNANKGVELLKKALEGISSNVPTTTLGTLLPAVITGPLQSLLAVGQSALSEADNVLGIVDPAAVKQISFYAQAALSAGNSILDADSSNGLSFSAASSLLHVLSYAGIINNIYTNNTPITKILNLINPDLPSLAAQIFGDGSRWLEIGQANGINEPYPIGQYQIGIPENISPAQNLGKFL